MKDEEEDELEKLRAENAALRKKAELERLRAENAALRAEALYLSLSSSLVIGAHSGCI